MKSKVFISIISIAIALIAKSTKSLAEETKIQLEIPQVANGSVFATEFNSINYYLVFQINTTDPESNLKGAESWYNKLLEGGHKSNEHLLSALRLFLALGKKFEGNEKCNLESSKIISLNDQATLGRAHLKPNKKVCLRRIEKVVKHFAQKHAEECLQVYQKRFKTKISLLDEDKKNNIDNLLLDSTTLREERTRYYHYNYHNERNVNLKLAKNITDFELFQAKLVEVSLNDTDSKYLNFVEDELRGVMDLDKEKYEDLVNRLAIEPCNYWINEVGQILKSVEYDSSWSDKKEGRNSYFAWEQYDFCKEMISLRSYLIEGLMSYVKSDIDLN